MGKKKKKQDLLISRSELGLARVLNLIKYAERTKEELDKSLKWSFDAEK